MKHHYFYRSLATVGLLLTVVGFSGAQAPVITAVVPMANAGSVAPTAPLTVSFSQPLAAGSAAALQVFSSQRGGLRTRAVPATVSGNTLSFAPTAFSYQPGEVVQYSVTTAAASSSGALARPQVGRFAVATGGTGAGYFAPAAATAVGNQPQGLAVGDLDGDGDQDCVTANNLDSNLSICLNNGNAAFAAGATIALPGQPLAVALGDLDGDGDLDLVTSYPPGAQPGGVQVMFNNGAGVFGSPTTGRLGNVSAYPLTLALGDVDGDGDLDVLLADSQVQALSVLLNNGAGSFAAAATNIRMWNPPFGLVVGDFDNDGDLDAAMSAGNGAYEIVLLLNDGRGGFQVGSTLPTPGGSYRVLADDLDGDGDLDLVSTNYFQAIVHFNDGTGQFAAPVRLTLAATNNLVVADVDHDGDSDLVTISQNSSSITVLLNNGSGSFQAGPSVFGRHGVMQVLAGDADGDGDLDLFYTTNTPVSEVHLLLNGPRPGLGTTATAAAANWRLTPNPATSSCLLTGVTSHAPVQLLDALGRSVLMATADAAGTARLALPAGLAPGLYLVRSGGRSQRLLVE
ncbi:Ig-like domain-containing protein [Hymenobacter sp. ASUV-10]|uniref:Ig-like domain-containing protein n=1 Tax=Hymenobacter aranciens TaxID=3063996 RepID=A0ABT9BAR4_9BACT|nr:Ig-like domain-containing protein [Hymenobacter sp. ASUV-10]MDO7875282.1 Ig-like domain-containing protein [Hymenobacter sp. ASUV-10]